MNVLFAVSHLRRFRFDPQFHAENIDEKKYHTLQGASPLFQVPHCHLPRKKKPGIAHTSELWQKAQNRCCGNRGKRTGRSWGADWLSFQGGRSAFIPHTPRDNIVMCILRGELNPILSCAMTPELLSHLHFAAHNETISCAHICPEPASPSTQPEKELRNCIYLRILACFLIPEIKFGTFEASRDKFYETNFRLRSMVEHLSCRHETIH